MLISVYKYFLISISVFTFSTGLYFLMHVVIVYKNFNNKYFYFALSNIFASISIFFSFMRIGSETEILILFSKFVMITIGISSILWLTSIYKNYFKDTLFIKIMWVVLLIPILLIPSSNYYTNDVIHHTFNISGEIVSFKIAKMGIFYILHSVIIVIVTLIVFFKIIISKNKFYEKILTFFVLSPIFGGIFDVLISMSIINSLYIKEFFFFIGIMGYFIYFFREERLKYIRTLSLNKKLEEKVKIRTEKLFVANDKLQKQNDMKNQFITNITHDFRSPLMVILNISDLIIKMNPSISIKDDLDLINASAQKLKKTVDRLLELAKIDEKGLKLNLIKFDIGKYLIEITDYYKKAIRNKPIEIRILLPVNRTNEIIIDPEIFDEIINNVMSNAIKFTDQKNGIIEVELMNNKDNIIITITDNGIGIQKDKLGMIFNRFEQLRGNNDIKCVGTGIGLSFSKELTKYMNGDIWVESDGENSGTKFFIKFDRIKYSS